MIDPNPATHEAVGSRFVVLCTVPDARTATELSRSLVQAKVAACVNVVPGVTSFYHWEGAVCQDQEHLLVAKTDGAHLQELIDMISRDHPYECPEAIALKIVDGARAYLEWIGTALAED